MPDPLGLSFMPDAQGNGSQDQNGPRPTPVQQAIQTLSLRIPRTVGASGGAPQQLLQGAGSMGLGGGNPNSAAMLEQIRRMLFGGGGGHFGIPGLPRAGDPGMPGAPFGGMPMPKDGPAPDAGGRGTLPMPNVGFPLPGVKDPTDNGPSAAPAPAPSPLGGSAPLGPMPSGPRDRRI